jgi:hypothetical protein
MNFRCKPYISCIFWWWGDEGARWSEEQVSCELDNMQALGVDSLILVGLHVHLEYLDQVSPKFDSLAYLMESAQSRGMNIIFGGVSSNKWWDKRDVQGELEINVRLAQRLFDEYGDYLSFGGWYIPHEIYLPVANIEHRFIRELYRELAKEFHTVADKKVVLSPFFILDKHQRLGPYPYGDPLAYEIWWTEVLLDTCIDIVALQDSGEHLSFYSIAEREPFFQALRSACDKTDRILWGNLETGELVVDNFEAFMRDFGCHVNNAKTREHWRAVSARKMQAKAEMIACYVDKIMSWGYREYVRPSLGEESKRVHKEYKEYVMRFF